MTEANLKKETYTIRDLYQAIAIEKKHLEYHQGIFIERLSTGTIEQLQYHQKEIEITMRCIVSLMGDRYEKVVKEDVSE